VLLASLTGSVTSFIGNHGVYAVFALMLLSAVVPAASEVVMIYGGAVAAGAFASAHVSLFGHPLSSGASAYIAMALAGVIGSFIGALIGWAIGTYGGRPFLERHGRWLHVTPARLERGERWFDRFGPYAVVIGLSMPLVRSFVAIPAGIAGLSLRRFAPLALLGSVPFCFGLSGAGYALGSNWTRVHDAFGYVDWVILAGALALAAYLVLRWRSSRLSPRA